MHASRLSALALPGAYRLWRQLVDFDDASMLAIEAEVQELLARLRAHDMLLDQRHFDAVLLGEDGGHALGPLLGVLEEAFASL